MTTTALEWIDTAREDLDRGDRIDAIDSLTLAIAQIRASLPPAPAVHRDDAAVDAFAAAMKVKLAKARAKGRGGWRNKGDCTQAHLSDLLRRHVEKGDPLDVANFCLFLHQRGEGIAATPPAAAPVMDTMRAAGQRLSNIAYNFAQSPAFPSQDRATLDEARRGWDAALAAVRNAPAPHRPCVAGAICAGPDVPVLCCEKCKIAVGAAPAVEDGRILTCVYCGQEYPQGTASWGASVLTDHIKICAKHPMREAEQDNDRLRTALVGLVGESDPDELRKMEAMLRLLPAPAEDKAATIDAIHALLALPSTAPGRDPASE